MFSVDLLGWLRFAMASWGSYTGRGVLTLARLRWHELPFTRTRSQHQRPRSPRPAQEGRGLVRQVPRARPDVAFRPAPGRQGARTRVATRGSAAARLLRPPPRPR